MFVAALWRRWSNCLWKWLEQKQSSSKCMNTPFHCTNVAVIMSKTCVCALEKFLWEHRNSGEGNLLKFRQIMARTGTLAMEFSKKGDRSEGCAGCRVYRTWRLKDQKRCWKDPQVPALGSVLVRILCCKWQETNIDLIKQSFCGRIRGNTQSQS